MRYIKLYFHYVKLCFIQRLNYKADLIIGILAFLVGQVLAFLGMYFLVRSFPSLTVDGQNWDIYRLGLLYGFVMLPVGIDHILSDALWLVAYRYVRMGLMDKYFLRPLPVLFQVLAERFQLEGLGELSIAIFMIIFSGINAHITFNFEFVFLLFIVMVFGALLITSIKIFFASFAFKLKATGPALQIAYNFKSYVRFPMGIYPKFIQVLLYFVIPFGFVIFLPVQTLLFGSYNAYLLGLCIVGISLLFFGLSLLTWKLLIRTFESTGN